MTFNSVNTMTSLSNPLLQYTSHTSKLKTHLLPTQEDKLSRIHEEFDENLIREEIDASEMKHAELERSRDRLELDITSLQSFK